MLTLMIPPSKRRTKLGILLWTCTSSYSVIFLAFDSGPVARRRAVGGCIPGGILDPEEAAC